MSEKPAEEAGGKSGKRRSGKVLVAALAVALLAGGGAFYATYSGMLALPFLGAKSRVAGDHGGAHEDGAGGVPEDRPSFVPLDPLILSLGPRARAEHLRVALVLEVSKGREDAVAAVQPRIVDVLNEFLRAVDESDFETPWAMARLRAQMLRRVLLVSPEGAVRDLLVQEFVLR